MGSNAHQNDLYLMKMTSQHINSPDLPFLDDTGNIAIESEDEDLPGPFLPALISRGSASVEDAGMWPLRKNFSAQHNRWRRRMVTHLRENPDLFPLLQERTGGDPARIRDLIDEEAAGQQVYTRILQLTYPDRDLGNHSDPLDELIYIMISRRTRESAYQGVFQNLKVHFSDWAAMADSPTEEIERIIGPAGLGEIRAQALQQTLRAINEELGSYSLEQLREWTDDRVETFLCGLPGVGPKSAYCVMMYSLGRAAFPVDTHNRRVLERLGVFRQAGLDLTAVGDHKRAQAVLADLIAPELRHSLHVSLVLHGRDVCQLRPRCEECAISPMCGFFRARKVREAEESSGPTMVDLFCGAGGLSEGFRQAGYRTVLAVDSNPVALRTYRMNHPEVPDERVICEDLKDFRQDGERLARLIANQPIDVLIGGPPCQGFSRAGWRSRGTGRRFTATEDDRNYLFRELVGLLDVLRPRVFVMENVPGLGEVQFADGSSFLGVMRQAMEDAGYQTTLWLLNAAAYGVPQHRVRKIIVGVRDGDPPAMPPARYRAAAFQYHEHSRSTDDSLPLAVTLGEAIEDLPALASDDGEWITRHGNIGTSGISPEMSGGHSKRILHPQGLLFSHVSRYQNPTDLERYAELRPGENYMKLIGRRPELQNYRTDAFDDKYFRLDPTQPGKTIVAHLRKDGNSYIHPSQTRSITVREAARLQSFPDTYIFTGSRGDQFTQIGNAVPPLLARAIAEQLLTIFQNDDPVSKDQVFL
jgi:DNA (cytosine-5)-methyltransferase 1